MPALFVSHASKDDRHACGLEAWLKSNGFTDLFLDHDGIIGGDKWRTKLSESAGACRVMAFLVTENWLSSADCFGEFVAGFYMGKRMIPLFCLPAGAAVLDAEQTKRLLRVRSEDQGIDVSPCLRSDGVLDLAAQQSIAEQLRTALRAAGASGQVGLDPESFAINATLRPTPFPGLVSFGDHDADAALFYGRSREISETLEELRKMRAEGDYRPLVILGSSGSGKSSLLKAGIIPRLRREAPAWLPLRAFRPGANPLLNFAEALSRTLADFNEIEGAGVIRDRLIDGWRKCDRDEGGDLTPAALEGLRRRLETEGERLRRAADCPNATILVSLDQAEEIAQSNSSACNALVDYLHAASMASWHLAFAIRTDSFPDLQSNRRFRDLRARGYDLRALPVFHFVKVVEEPARRYGVEIEPALVDALVDDTPKQDALPLLAFALQTVWRQYGDVAVLTKSHYENVGGLRELLEDAAERALRGIEPEQDVTLLTASLDNRVIDIAASTFVPALAQVNEQGTPVRRVAAWSEFSHEQQAVLKYFIRWYLVVRKGDTIEVAHEALFREWTRLKSWLEPERSRLDALRSLQIDAATWHRGARDPAYLNHRARRLTDACVLMATDAYRKRLTRVDLDYVNACKLAAKTERTRRRRSIVAFVALAVPLAAGLGGWLNEGYLRARLRWLKTVRPYVTYQVHPFVLTPEAERALQPGKSFRECAKNCPEMIVIPAGSFAMGSPSSQEGHNTNEDPQHTVVVKKPFAVSKLEVTFDDWDACVAFGDCPQVSDSGWGHGRQPVIHVTWDEAQIYVQWISTVSGRPYRLLSEAEWEYAARGGASTVFSFGDGPSACGEYAWFVANSGNHTHAAGEKRPNGFGLYDVHGNVWEWTADCYHRNYNGAPNDGSPWVDERSDCIGVARGGGWSSDPGSRYTAARLPLPHYSQNYDIGFRLARTLVR